VPLGPIVQRLRGIHAGQLADLGGRLEAADDLATPLADPSLLEQILLNLVGNAIAYHRPGVGPLVRVTTAAAGGEVIVAVTDNGRGIAPDQLERVFDVFTRATSDQDLTHAGIGLATVRRAARAMGTDVTVESTVGSGTTFSLVLPRA
jgi:signal transduction histidine kinase